MHCQNLTTRNRLCKKPVTFNLILNDISQHYCTFHRNIIIKTVEDTESFIMFEQVVQGFRAREERIRRDEETEAFLTIQYENYLREQEEEEEIRAEERRRMRRHYLNRLQTIQREEEFFNQIQEPLQTLQFQEPLQTLQFQ